MATPTDSLRWTSLTPDSVGAWAELTSVLAEADGTGEFYEAEDLAEELEEHGFTPESDSWAVWDDDRLVGYGQLRVGFTPDDAGRIRCRLGGGVHPQWRGRGIGRRLMDAMETRAPALASERHPGVPAYFSAHGELEDSSTRRMLTSRGYVVVRYFNELTRRLPGEPLPPTEMDGAALMTPTEAHEEALRVAHNVAFRDHWGATETTAEQWHDYWTARSNRLPLSTLALADDGSVLSYVLAGQWVPGELHIAIVGTVPQGRGRGLAAACMTRTLMLAAETGQYTQADLEVDSDSPTGATRLYERLGFTLTKTFGSMQRSPD
ncbi:MAG: GNAT family N-acetyltransferase [Dermatophilaceae bacterium]|nr:GNAT family N-acetyltransferase [Intrasporangiaceae bacterium]